MAHDRRMSLLRLEEGLEQRIPLAAHDVNKRHHWQGFDCGDVPDNILDIPVTPLSLDDPDTMKDLQMYSIFALKKCTKLEKKKYQFVKVLKANVCLRRGFFYHITFQAEDIAGSGSPLLNFRTIVHSLKGRQTVEFCEPEL